MIKYELEDGNNSKNLFLVDEDHNIKRLIAVVYEPAHAGIIKRGMNEYYRQLGIGTEESIDHEMELLYNEEVEEIKQRG